MRLVAVTLSGYKRFAEPAKIDFDGSLVAVVGPNEAGKTSTLQALVRLNDGEPFARSELTRGASFPADHVVVDALYLVESDDRAEVEHLHGGRDPERTRWLRYQKLSNGAILTTVIPGLERDVRPRRKAARQLAQLRKAKLWKLEGGVGGAPLHAESLDNLQEALRGDDQMLAQETLQALSDVAAALRDLEGDDRLGELAAILDDLRKEEAVHPTDEAASLLADVRPGFLLFDEDERELLTEYDLDTVATHAPPALSNLAAMAGLDLSHLRRLVAADDSGAIKDLLERTNARLKASFDAWSQYEVTATIDRGDGPTIRIHVSNPAGGYSQLEERSDGLKAFIALLALTARNEWGPAPIVLIDEAERHLHYDGQADLVQVFARQEALPQIIYTTHSAGCMPEDLGTGVRIVAPIEATNHSRVINRFWTEGEGFAPLLLGMGASTLAFVPVRNAVLSEGPSEIIVLPCLFREALDLKSVGF